MEWQLQGMQSLRETLEKCEKVKRTIEGLDRTRAEMNVYTGSVWADVAVAAYFPDTEKEECETLVAELRRAIAPVIKKHRENQIQKLSFLLNGQKPAPELKEVSNG